MLLPPELIDHILSFLRGDISALKACSKAHITYSRLAERHLYADLVVHTTNPWKVSELYKQLSENSRILGYPRTLDFRIGVRDPVPEVLSIMSMIPRMANLMSLTLYGQPATIDLYEDFLSTLRTCLHQSSVEEVNLYLMSDFPFSVLDNGKHIKKLMLIDCIAREEPVSNTAPPHQSLETLIICGDHDPDLLFWTTRHVTRLTTLELQDASMIHKGTAFPELLAACSNSLTSLHLDVAEHCQSTYSYHGNHQTGLWADDNLAFPFTLSSHTRLKNISISALVHSTPTSTRIHYALPAIIRLIKTVPSIQQVVLRFYCDVPDVTTLGRLDWSPLNRLWSNVAGIRPRVELRISGGVKGRLFSPASILNVLLKNEALVHLVNRDVVILKPDQEIL